MFPGFNVAKVSSGSSLVPRPEAIEDTGRELSAISGSVNPGPVIAEKLLMWFKKVQERMLQADKPAIESNNSLGKYDADK